MRTLTLILCLLAGPLFAEDVLVPVAAEVKHAEVEIVSRAQAIDPMDCIKIWLKVPAKAFHTVRISCHPEPKVMQDGYSLKDNRPFVLLQVGAQGSFGLSVAYYDGEMHMTKYVVNTGGDIDPRPFPKPPPTPVPGKRTVIILEQAEDRTPAQAAVMTSTKLRSYLESKGHQFRVQDVDQLAQTDNAPRSPLPRLIIEDGDGKLLFQGPFPATVDGVIETIKAHGG